MWRFALPHQLVGLLVLKAYRCDCVECVIVVGDIFRTVSNYSFVVFVSITFVLLCYIVVLTYLSFRNIYSFFCNLSLFVRSVAKL